MCACGIDLEGRHIGSLVTFFAGVRFAGRFNGESVPGMATGTTALAAVRIDPAHTYIGPGDIIKFTIFDFHHTAVTMITSGRTLDIIIHTVVKPRIYLPDDLHGMGMFAFIILGRFRRVTTRAIFG